MIKLYNTLGRKKQIFKPIKKNKVGLYSCGPTVYWYAHIGNLRSYIFADILKRTLKENNYKVKHIINITDVGHLTSDADTGEDKLEIGAKREKKTAWQIAEFYTRAFKKDLEKLNIEKPTKWIKATDTIKEQIKFIQLLEKKGYTYQLEDGLYFDTSKIKDYGELTGKKERKLKGGARVKLIKGKRNITDFALWKFSKKKRQMEWNSPWGIGFPGWHTECVVMAIKYLGIPFDIHTGGIDHIPTHHTNEIAQAKAGYNKKLANYWLHNEFIIQKGEKMAKSKGEITTLDKVIEKGFDPLAYRYLVLTSHYRSKLDFSWESLKSAQNTLNTLRKKTLKLKQTDGPVNRTGGVGKDSSQFREFFKYINDDLDTPKAIALMWKLIKEEKLNYKTILEIDKIFGLNLKDLKEIKVPSKVTKLAKEREKFRKEKNWQKADDIRKEIEELGFSIKDKANGYEIHPLW